MIKENKLITCKICLIEQVALFGGRFPNGKDSKWLDVNGKLFNGRICPNCQRTCSKNNMKLKRDKNVIG